MVCLSQVVDSRTPPGKTPAPSRCPVAAPRSVWFNDGSCSALQTQTDPPYTLWSNHPMGGDTVVALGRATVDGHTLLGHNSDRPVGESQVLCHTPGRSHSAGEMVPAQCI